MIFSVLAVGERGRESGKGNVVRIKVVFCTAHCTVLCMFFFSSYRWRRGRPHSRRLFSPCCSFEGEKKRLLLSFVEKALVFLPFRDAENRRIGREEVFFVGKEVGAQLSIVKREN